MDQFTTGLMLASLILVVCTLRADFLISELRETNHRKLIVDMDGPTSIIMHINLVVYIILGLMSILLICAIYKKHHLLMVPWIVTALVSVFCELIFVIYLLLRRNHPYYLIFVLTGSALILWVIWAIYNLYKTVENANRVEHVENVPDRGIEMD